MSEISRFLMRLDEILNYRLTANQAVAVDEEVRDFLAAYGIGTDAPTHWLAAKMAEPTAVPAGIAVCEHGVVKGAFCIPPPSPNHTRIREKTR